MRRGSKSVKAEVSAALDPGEPEGTIANDPRTKKGRGLFVRKALGNGVSEGFGNLYVLGKPTIYMVSREFCIWAKVFLSSPAKGTFPAGPMQPGHAHAGSHLEPACARAQSLHIAHDLVPRHDRLFPQRKLPFGNMEIGVADPAGRNANKNLPRPGGRSG